MSAPLTSAWLPTWHAVELRGALAACTCVRTVDARAYARSSCPACNGAGVLLRDAGIAPAEAA